MCILVSALLDSFDGRVARMIGHSSQFGAELDSLSDLVCFGVAPAIVLFMRIMYQADNLGWGICTFFAVCCALRLARFNTVQIMSERTEEKRPDWMKKYFTGVPAPAGAVLALLPMILYFATENMMFLNTFFVSLCILFSGIMMISRVKSFSAKMIEFKEGFASPELIVMTLVIICLINSPWVTLSALTIIYIIMIPYGAYCYKQRKEKESAHSPITSDEAKNASA